jgi:AraC family transcriptional regulator
MSGSPHLKSLSSPAPERASRTAADVELPPFDAAAIARVVEAAGGSLPAHLVPRLATRDPRVAHLIRALLAELDAPSPAARPYVDALSRALALRLAQSGGGSPPARGGQTLSSRQMRRIDELITSELGEHLPLTRIAAAAGISVSHLTPMFRRTTGTSVHRYVLERRVAAARELLATTDYSLAEIASRTGFSHQSHLAKWMRRVIGGSPAAIRKSLRRR